MKKLEYNKLRIDRKVQKLANFEGNIFQRNSKSDVFHETVI